MFDIEGTDSAERADQKQIFEQTTSLFALVISDVVLLNMWATDIGRAQAANYEILKVIFECNLKLFHQTAKKKLLFVLRDFTADQNQEMAMWRLKSDLQNIWQGIYKPEKYKSTALEDFFELDFVFLPHKKFEEAKFNEETKALRERFYLDTSHPKSIFLPRTDNTEPPLPIDGLSIFYSQTWDVIRN